MKIALRVDASRLMGTGHLRRCLSLAHALKAADAELMFVTRDLGFASGEIIAAEGFYAVRLPEPRSDFPGNPAIPHSQWAGVAESADAAETIDAIAGWRPDWTVVDSYSFGSDWHESIARELGCWVAAIDDVADRQFACDLLVDHNLAQDHREKYRGRLDAAAKLLGGPHYALLGPAYAEAPRYAFSENVRSIGIFLGGIDSANLSALVLNAIEDAGFFGPVEIVATSANPNLETLRETARRREGIRLSVDLPDLTDFFGRHDLQVGAGGGATWERCCIGAPALLLVIAENQKAVAPQLASAGVAAMARSLDCAEVANAVSMLIADAPRRRKLAERSRALVDGRGASRVAKELLCSG